MAMSCEVCCGEDRSVGAGLGKGFINHTGCGGASSGDVGSGKVRTIQITRGSVRQNMVG